MSDRVAIERDLGQMQLGEARTVLERETTPVPPEDTENSAFISVKSKGPGRKIVINTEALNHVASLDVTNERPQLLDDTVAVQQSDSHAWNIGDPLARDPNASDYCETQKTGGENTCTSTLDSCKSELTPQLDDDPLDTFHNPESNMILKTSQTPQPESGGDAAISEQLSGSVGKQPSSKKKGRKSYRNEGKAVVVPPDNAHCSRRLDPGKTDPHPYQRQDSGKTDRPSLERLLLQALQNPSQVNLALVQLLTSIQISDGKKLYRFQEVAPETGSQCGVSQEHIPQTDQGHHAGDPQFHHACTRPPPPVPVTGAGEQSEPMDLSIREPANQQQAMLQAEGVNYQAEGVNYQAEGVKYQAEGVTLPAEQQEEDQEAIAMISSPGPPVSVPTDVDKIPDLSLLEMTDEQYRLPKDDVKDRLKTLINRRR